MKTKKLSPLLFAIIACIISACSVSLPGGEEVQKTVKLGEEEFIIQLKASTKVEADVIGAPHVPLAIPTAGVSKEVAFFVIRQGYGGVLVGTLNGYEELPTKEELQEILSLLKMERSPDGHMLAFWNEKGKEKEILYMLKAGAPFRVLETGNKAPVGEETNWNKMVGIEKAFGSKIKECPEDYGFWENIIQQPRGTFVDERLLEAWPSYCHGLKSSLKAIINPASGASEAWRKRAVNKAGQVFFSSSSGENLRYDAMQLIVASEDRAFIDKMDRSLVENWPQESFSNAYTYNRINGRMVGVDNAMPMSDENMKMLIAKVWQSIQNPESNYLSAAYKMAKELQDKEMISKCLAVMVEQWPESYWVEVNDGYSAMDAATQDRLLDRAEQHIDSKNEPLYKSRKAVEMLNEKAGCQRLQRLIKQYPEKITLREDCKAIAQ